MTTAGTASEIVVKADNETAFDFLHKLDTHKFPNVFISPFSVNMALSVTANGARGTTLAEMQKALHLPITISQVDGILIWQPNRFQVPGL